MTKLRPRAVIFDLGSTLIDYEPMPWDEMSRICVDAAYDEVVRRGLTAPAREEWHNRYAQLRTIVRDRAMTDLIEYDVTDLLEEMVRTENPTATREVADALFDCYYAPLGARLTIYDDTLATLDRLRDSVEVIGLISNTFFPERAHLQELNQFGIMPFLDFSMFSSTFGLRKPHPDIFSSAAAMARVPPRDCVYVGDRYREDISGPASIGMPAILKHTANREYPDPIPSDVRVIKRLTELGDHLEF